MRFWTTTIIKHAEEFENLASSHVITLSVNCDAATAEEKLFCSLKDYKNSSLRAKKARFETFLGVVTDNAASMKAVWRETIREHTKISSHFFNILIKDIIIHFINNHHIF